ncbi:hypothetical protein [Thalassobius sp. Cn5-15]|uniref:hypothetical protein n=1 Tax=Thalassobius sp. Cn5-15 TaxID=2917763 RepID=UPI001EF29471|nr:hypothetical protein [Thalassobius sp. Cn5-15]MCG7494107.1 hypothetical protein [Thalassobius sp. Cn5-15]
MTKNLDDRIADLEGRRRSTGKAAVNDAGQTVEDLKGAVRQASLSVGGLNARTDLIEERTYALEKRLRRIWLFNCVGVAAALFISLIIASFAIWFGAKEKAAAENEADLLRATYAAEIEAVREEGEAELTRVHADLAQKVGATEAKILDVGAELQNMLEEREAVRQELEHFVTLRERVGIKLVEFRGRTVVVVPEGARLRRWRAAGLSEIAHLNGRMYRLSD